MAHSKKASEIVASLTKLEKAALLSGKNVWQTRAIERLGVPAIFMSDGPHGIRKQVGSSDHLGINASEPATCFPTSATIANSWDLSLAERVGTALGQEAAHIGVDVLLGPGMNIKRSPLCGRNFEYFSEDPYLTGVFGSAYIKGIQSAGIAACPKHFAVNSQETRRMTSNSVIDQKTLREIYLTAFEIAVKEAHPRTIMSSYNQVNGTYAHENPFLLQQILRDEWQFDGAVVTDWGGSNDAVRAISAGGSIEMPSPGFDSVEQIMAAADLDEAALDARVQEMVELALRLDPKKPEADVFTRHNELARTAAEQTIVLLKNEDDILPLQPQTKVAVIGQFAFNYRYQGAGSSLVNPTKLVNPLEALADSELNVVAKAPGFEHGKPSNPELVAAAKEAARQGDVVLLYLGLDEIAESEGKDRDHIRIPANQIALLEEIQQVNPRIVVVLAAGSAVEMPWLDQCAAVIHGYLGGQAGAPAMVSALTGQINPSGRLTETYPLSLDDTPTAGNFPVTERHSLYREGPYVGYRYYESAQVPVLFPFGFGLSYTEFTYSNLEVTSDGVSFDVKNSGAIAGSDVPQLYVKPAADVAKLGPAPVIELKGFTKVHLAPGEQQRVQIPFDDYTFRHFDATDERWVTVAGEYGIAIGRNVRELVLETSLAVAGENVATEAASSKINAYATGQIRNVTDADFAVLLDDEVPDLGARVTTLGVNSPLSDLKYARSAVGRGIYRFHLQRGLRKAEEKGVPDLDLLFQFGMPFRAIAKMSGGLADRRMVDGILTLVNGKFFRGLGQVIKRFFSNRKRQKALGKQFDQLASGATTTSVKGK